MARPVEPPRHRRDWRVIVLLGVVGHRALSAVFLAGVARTSVAQQRADLRLHAGGRRDFVVDCRTRAADRRRAGSGAALSLAGIYVIVGHRASFRRSTLLGDALVFAGMVCWSLYSVVAQPLLKRHSPLVVTGWSMAIGAALYLRGRLPAGDARRTGRRSR